MERAEYWGVVSSQPASLRTTLDAARAALADARTLPTWRPEGLAAVIAMGASTCAGEFLVAAARRRGRVVLNWAASDWADIPRLDVDVAIGVSESGRSPETIVALSGLGERAIALTNVVGSPATIGVGAVVGWGDVVDAGVYLSGYTSSLVALGLVGEALGLDGLADGLDALPQAVADWLPRVFAAVEGLLAAHFPDTMPSAVDCVGSQESLAAAGEAALMMREAGRTPSASFSTDQYLHGPAESLATDQVLVVLGGGRAMELARLADALGVPLLHVAAEPVGRFGLALPAGLGPVGVAVLEAVVGQVLAGRLGERRGHELGTFRLTFEGTKLPVG